jgi:hypothetical protein
MSIHVIPDSRTYAVNDNGTVTVRATIGDAQGGGWVVAWDDQSIIAKGSAPDLVTVGIGQAIRGKTLQVVVTAVDIRPQTNRLSRVLALDGGSEGLQKFVGLKEDGDAGDIAVFATLVTFQ